MTYMVKTSSAWVWKDQTKSTMEATFTSRTATKSSTPTSWKTTLSMISVTNKAQRLREVFLDPPLVAFMSQNFLQCPLSKSWFQRLSRNSITALWKPLATKSRLSLLTAKHFRIQFAINRSKLSPAWLLSIILLIKVKAINNQEDQHQTCTLTSYRFHQILCPLTSI